MPRLVWFSRAAQAARDRFRRLLVEPLERRELLATWSGALAADTTWTAAEVHRITGAVTVPTGVKLTIQPGTVVKFDYGDNNLFVNGTLDARGTSLAPIVFTSYRDDSAGGDTNNDGPTSGGAGDWGEIRLGAGSSTNVMQHVEVRYGGSWGSRAELVAAGPLASDSLVVRNSYTEGLRLEGTTATFTNTIWQNNNQAAASADLAASPTIVGVTMSGNNVNALALDSGSLLADNAWNDPDIVYWLTGDVTVPVGRTLTIAAGQVVKFQFGDVNLLVNGTLAAVGTPVRPIIFTSHRDDSAGGDSNNNGPTGGGAGDWGEVRIGATSSASVLHDVEVRYGGSWGSRAELVVAGPLASDSLVVRNSYTEGLRLEGTTATFTNTTWQNNGQAAASADLAASPTIVGVTMSGNYVNALALDSGSLLADNAWNDPDIVYWLTGDVTVPVGRTLTIAAGQVVKFQFGDVNLLVNGTLAAVGTPVRPIIFTSHRDDSAGGDSNNNGATGGGAGDWGEVRIGATSSASVLHDVEVRYGGSWGSRAELVVAGPLDSDSLVVRNSYTEGLRLEGTTATFTNTTWQNNGQAAASADLAASPTIVGVTMSGNYVNALALDSGSLLADNAWNDPDIVYWLTGDVTVPVGRTLTVAAGQIVKFQFGDVNLLVNGTLAALGTPQAPIIFTSHRDDSAGGDSNNNGATSGGAGDWGEVRIGASSSASVLHDVEVRYGGSWGSRAELVVAGPLDSDSLVVRNSYTEGLRLEGTTATFTNTTWQNNSQAAASADLAASPTIVGVTMSGNNVNALALDSGSLPASSAWNDPDIVYWLTGDVVVPAGRTLSVAAGQVVKFNFGDVNLLVDGTLAALGTSQAPIVFTSHRDDSAGGDSNNNGATSGGAGDWGEIRVRAGGTGSVLTHVDVRDGGSWGSEAQVVADGAPLTIAASVVRDSYTGGIWAKGDAQVTVERSLVWRNSGAALRASTSASLVARNDTIDGNQIGVYVTDASVELTNNLITFQTSSGVRRDGAGTILARFNSVFSNPNPANDYVGVASFAGTQGNDGADPHYFLRANGLFQLRGGSPAIDSGTSDGAPTTDILDSARYDDPGVLNLGAGTLPYFDRGAWERQEISTSNLDLVATSATAPAVGQADETIVVSWTVRNEGSEAALGGWYDGVYLSSDEYWTPDDLLLGEVRHDGTLGAGESYGGSTSVRLPGVVTADYRLIVRTDSRDEVFEARREPNNNVASGPIALDVPELVLGAPRTGTLAASGASRLYKVRAAAGDELNVSLTGGAGAVNELYSLFAGQPSRQSFDERSARAGQANQSLSLVDAPAGFHFILVYGADLTSGETFTIVANSTTFGVTGVSPPRGSRAGQATVHVEGARFRPGSVVRLIDSAGHALSPLASYFVDASQLAATFDLTGAALGPADVVVENPDHATTARLDAFEITAGPVGRLSAQFVGPSRVRRDRDFTGYVEVANVGETDLLAPILLLETTSLTTIGLRPDRSDAGSRVLLIGAGPAYPSGILAPGAVRRIPIYGHATSNGDETISLAVADYPASAIDWDTFGERLRPEGATDADWALLESQLAAQFGSTWTQYQTRLSTTTSLLPSELGNDFSLEDVVQLELRQAVAALNVSVSGRVYLRDTDHPLENADVRLVDATTGEARGTVSLRDGRFLIPQVPPGTYDVSFADYVLASPRSITIGATDVDGVDLIAQLGSYVTGGLLLAPDSIPARGASITAVRDDGSTYAAEGADDGTYRLGPLPAGTYSISAVSPLTSPSAPRTVVVAAETTYAHVNLSLPIATALTGVVLAPSGPVEDATVVATAADGRKYVARTDAAGQYRLLAPGGETFTVSASSAGFVAVERIANLPPTGTLTGFDFSLAAVAGTIAGQVVRAAGGAPVANVQLVATKAGLVRYASSDANGAFSFADLPAGTYQVEATVAGEMLEGASVAGVIVTGGATTSLPLLLASRAQIIGHVTAQGSGTPVSKVIVQLVDDQGAMLASTLTDADGAYALDDIPPGSYDVVLGAEFSTGVARTAITTTAGAAPRTVDFAIPYVGLLKGRALDHDGVTPLSDIDVFVTTGGTRIDSMSTDADGNFAFVVLAAGTYQLEAIGSGRDFAMRSGLTPSGGATLGGLDLVAGGEMLRGTITGPTGPVANAAVGVRHADSARIDSLITVFVTDAQGRYEFPFATPGAYELTASAPGLATAFLSATVVAGVPTTANLTLTAERTLTGAIRAAGSGLPLADAQVFVTSRSAPGLRASSGVDAEGRFVVRTLAAGEHRVVVRAAGFETLVLPSVTITAPTTERSWSLKPATTFVRGTVRSGTAGLLAATVVASDADGVVGAAATEPDGTYELAGLPAGAYQLTVVASGHFAGVARSVTLGSGAGGVLAGVDFDVVAATLPDIELDVPPRIDHVKAPYSKPPAKAYKLSPADVDLFFVSPKSECFRAFRSMRTSFDHAEELLKSATAAYETWQAAPKPPENLARVHDNVARGLSLGNAVLSYFKQTLTSPAQLNQLPADARPFAEKFFEDLQADITATSRPGDLDPKLGARFETLAQRINFLQTLLARSLGKSDSAYVDKTSPLAQILLLTLKLPPLDPAMEFEGMIAIEQFDKVLTKIDFIISGLKVIDARDKLQVEYSRKMQAYFDAVKSAAATLQSYGSCAGKPTTEPVVPPTPGVPCPTGGEGESTRLVACHASPPVPPGTHNVDRDPLSIRTSFDPNDKIGPPGVGPNRFVRPGPMQYEIEFENSAAAGATAPAQEVFITDVLDSDLDLSSLAVTEFGFGRFHYTVPEGLSFYATTIDLRANGIDLLVSFQFAVDVRTRTISATFRSLDPFTHRLPDDVDAGFLPVNDAAHDGEGFVRYVIRPRADATTGTEIRNRARIVFDTNAPIDTPETLNTIDAGAPTSQVATLAAQSDPTFVVSWSGADESNGAGIASYDLFVSDDGGPYQRRFAELATTSTSFTGQAGHTYGFFTVARDAAGQLEAPPTLADAVTTVVANFWTNLSEPLDVTGDRSISPIDALVIINELNLPTVSNASSGRLPTPPPNGYVVQFRWDVNADQFVSPIDALGVINYLNAAAGAEGESPTVSASPDASSSGAPYAVESPSWSENDAARTISTSAGASRILRASEADAAFALSCVIDELDSPRKAAGNRVADSRRPAANEVSLVDWDEIAHDVESRRKQREVRGVLRDA